MRASEAHEAFTVSTVFMRASVNERMTIGLERREHRGETSAIRGWRLAELHFQVSTRPACIFAGSASILPAILTLVSSDSQSSGSPASVWACSAKREQSLTCEPGIEWRLSILSKAGARKPQEQRSFNLIYVRSATRAALVAL